MPRIEFSTEIFADIEVVFDLARSIDLHKLSTGNTNEEAIAGKTCGLIELNETVTWRAKHFGVYQTLTSKIVEYKRPDCFVDEMVSGIFKYLHHQHLFLEEDDRVHMIDVFNYSAPLGVLGKMADRLFLKKYLHNLLMERNAMIKEYAESDKWKTIIDRQIEI